MDKESRKDLDGAIADIFAHVKKVTAIQGMTANNFGHAGNEFSSCDLLLVDEAGMMTVAEFCMLANVDVDDVIMMRNNLRLKPISSFLLVARERERSFNSSVAP